MGLIQNACVRLLLTKTFIKVLVRQFYIKLTKFTRRANGPRSLMRKLAAGYDFVKDMSTYNWEVIRCCRYCVQSLNAEKISTVLVYGEKDIIEVLHDWCLETSIRMSVLREGYENDKNVGRKTTPIEMAALMKEKIIVASLVNIESRIGRLRGLGVDHDRIMLLR
jgi:hypothetical protein